MRELTTVCGILHGAILDEYYKNGILKECTLIEKNTIETPVGRLVPQYENDVARKKFISSLTFYKNGALRKVSLQEQTEVKTPLGILSVELLTFYESGALMRVFPLNGKISGYWTEQNEYGLAKPICFDSPLGSITAKIICVYFYESGAVKSLTFWPQEKVSIKTSCGELPVRIGLSFYENGAIKSLEPLRPSAVKTPIGTIMAFDIDAIGITGDLNSLKFDGNGDITVLKTISNTVIVKSKLDNAIMTFAPSLVTSHFSDEYMAVKPLEISFKDGKVFFGDDKKSSFDIEDVSFNITNFDHKSGGNACSSTSCTGEV